jgi:hypothetical protein
MSDIDLGNNPVGTPPTQDEQQQMRAALGINAASTAAIINTAPVDSSIVDADQIAVTETAASGALRRATFATVWSWITGKLAALASITVGGAWNFGSTTRPTSGGTGLPTSNSLIMLSDADARYAATNDARLSDAREWTATTVTQAEAEAGTATTRRAWTAERVRQAVVAWWATINKSGIDTRTSFPNDDVTAATSANAAGAIVRRDGTGAFAATSLTATNSTSTGALSVTGLTTFGSVSTFTYSGGAAATHRGALGLSALATATAGTGVTTALAVNVGTAGSFVVNGGALGTPSSGTLTNCSGLPAAGVTGLGTLATQSGTFSGTSSGTNTGDETGPRIAALINAATVNTAIVDADQISLTETAASGAFRRATFATIWTWITGKLAALASITVGGAWNFGSTTRPTSSGTGLPLSNSLIMLSDGDTRYLRSGGFASTTANIDAINTDVLADRVSLTLVPGTYAVRFACRFSGVSPKFRLAFSGTFDRESAFAFTGNGGAGPVLRHVVLNTQFDNIYGFGGTVCFRVTATGVLSIQHAQLVSGASTSALAAGAFLELTQQ